MPSPNVRRFLGIATATLALLVVADASAKPAPKDDDDAASADDAKGSSAKADKKKGDDASDGDKDSKDGDAKDADAKDDADGDVKEPKRPSALPADPHSPHEVDGKDYYFIGLRYRHSLLPKFVLGLFVDGGPSVVSLPAFGIEAGKRRDGFEMIGALTYQSWGMDPFPFKGKNESQYAWEIVDSKLKMLKATADFLWSSKIAGDELQFVYGVTAGLSFVWGDLVHAQAHPNGSSTDPNTFVPCTAADANTTPYGGNYCNSADNQRWAGYVEPNWAGGGYRPMLWLTFGPQFGLRYKPAKEFVARLDLGFDLFSGFFFGAGIDYGL